MKKSELKTGMRVEHRNGTIRIVMLGTGHGSIMANKDSTMLLKSINNDLTSNNRPLDIITVYAPHVAVTNLLHPEQLGGILWKRKAEIEEMTIEQVCKELGRDIKIKKS